MEMNEQLLKEAARLLQSNQVKLFSVPVMLVRTCT